MHHSDKASSESGLCELVEMVNRGWQPLCGPVGGGPEQLGAQTPLQIRCAAESRGEFQKT